MKNYKGLIFLILILVTICGGFLLLLSFISSVSRNTGEITIVDTKNNLNDIDVEDVKMAELIYATISNDDIAVLKSLEGNTKAITLARQKWSNIQWNQNGTLVSILGLSNEGKHNIFIYNIATEVLRQVTFYKDYDISEYFWNDSDEILFLHGIKPERWIHSFKYSAKAQILKLNRVGGDIIYRNTKTNLLIFKDESEFTVNDKFGALISDLNNLNNEITQPIKSILSLDDTSVLIALTEDNLIYKYDLSSDNLSEPLDLNLKFEINLMCNKGDNFQINYFQNNRFIVLEIDSKELELFKEIMNPTIEENSIFKLEKCYNGEFLLKAEAANPNSSKSIRWFSNQQEFPELVILKDDTDVDVRIQ